MFPHNLQPKPNKQRTQPKTTIKSIVSDFFTKPIPLPIWLWNLIVIGIYLTVILFVIQLAFGLPIEIFFLLSG